MTHDMVYLSICWKNGCWERMYICQRVEYSLNVSQTLMVNAVVEFLYTLFNFLSFNCGEGY